MALQQITAGDLQGKGVTFLPDVPGLPAEQMKAKFEEILREVVIPRFNANALNAYDKAETKELITSEVEWLTEVVLQQAYRLINEAVDAAMAQIDVILEQGMLVEDPTTGTKNTVAVVFANMARWIGTLHNYEPITPEEFEALEIDPVDFEAMGIDPFDFETNGKNILVGG